MNRYGVFAVFVSLFSMMLFRVVDDDGVGADDIGDFTIEDDEPESNEKAEQKEEPTTTKPKEIEEVENQEMAELIAFKKRIETEQATNEALEFLTDKYPSFSPKEIISELQRIEKEEGKDVADMLNNPLGWENLYLTKFRKDEDDGPPAFDRGRAEVKEPFDFDEAMIKAREGDEDAQIEIFKNSKGA